MCSNHLNDEYRVDSRPMARGVGGCGQAVCRSKLAPKQAFLWPPARLSRQKSLRCTDGVTECRLALQCQSVLYKFVVHEFDCRPI